MKINTHLICLVQTNLWNIMNWNLLSVFKGLVFSLDFYQNFISSSLKTQFHHSDHLYADRKLSPEAQRTGKENVAAEIRARFGSVHYCDELAAVKVWHPGFIRAASESFLYQILSKSIWCTGVTSYFSQQIQNLFHLSTNWLLLRSVWLQQKLDMNCSFPLI